MKKEIKITTWQKQIVGFALTKLGNSFSSNNDSEFISGIRNSLRYLNEFIHDINPAPELTNEEAELSRSLHTYMRKYMDSIFSCVMHKFISENRGKAVWYSFIQELNKNKSIKNALAIAEVSYQNDETTDSLAMYMLLIEWEEHHNLVDAIKEIDSWEK